MNKIKRKLANLVGLSAYGRPVLVHQLLLLRGQGGPDSLIVQTGLVAVFFNAATECIQRSLDNARREHGGQPVECGSKMATASFWLVQRQLGLENNPITFL